MSAGHDMTSGSGGVEGGSGSVEAHRAQAEDPRERREDLDRKGRRTKQGPLAPWKFVISIVLAGALTGPALFDAAMTGIGVDAAVVRSFVAAFGTWVAVGIVNSMLHQAQHGMARSRAELAARSPRDPLR